MKKLSLLKLNNANEILGSKQMKQVKGGGAWYTCYCGFVGGAYEDDTFQVYDHSLNGALNAAGQTCDGLGATCSL